MSGTLESLNKHFGLSGKINFVEDHNLVKLEVLSQSSRLECYLQGAHITSFKHNKAGELLWLSPIANFAQGKAIRGGIPLCWPWFGKHSDASLQQHGFARNSLFEVSKTSALDNGDVEIVLRLTANETTLSIWPYQFLLEVSITLGESLSVELISHNKDDKPFFVTEAIHSYFKLDDISRLSIGGLEGAKYYDQLSDKECVQAEVNCCINQETDRIYQAPENGIQLLHNDGVKIGLVQENANAVVVWNPWVGKSASMNDFPDSGYKNMVCVEAANARYKVINLAPGSRHSIKQTLQIALE